MNASENMVSHPAPSIDCSGGDLRVMPDGVPIAPFVGTLVLCMCVVQLLRSLTGIHRPQAVLRIWQPCGVRLAGWSSDTIQSKLIKSPKS